MAQQPLGAEIQGGRELNYVSQKDVYAGSLFTRLIDAVNSLAKNAGVAAVGKLAPPPKIDSIQVQGTQNGGTITVPSEHLHWTLTHNQAIQKGVQYITEIATEPNFLQPHVVDHGCSRSGFLHLPTFQSDGVTPQRYFMRSYAQYHGSNPSEPTVLGGLTNATQIKMTGTSGTTLLPSTGSGTASPTGQQGGHGLGKVLDRPAPTTKRNVS
jgi:hypothetical protein